MPKISEFFGLTILMHWFDIKKHRLPHIHVEYGGDNAVFDLMGNVLEGDLGARAHRLVIEWCEERHSELQLAWNLAMRGETVPWIEPLR